MIPNVRAASTTQLTRRQLETRSSPAAGELSSALHQHRARLSARDLPIGFRHGIGTMKARMGATHFLTKTLPKVAAEMALSVLAYNLTRVINIVGIKPLIDAITA